MLGADGNKTVGPDQVGASHLLLTNVLVELAQSLIQAVQTDNFYAELIRVINRLAATDSAVVLAFAPDEPPTVLYAALHPIEANSFYHVYMQGAYLLSPLYQNWLELQSGFYRTEGLCEDGLEATEFSKHYFKDSGLCDEGNFLVQLPNERAVAVCFGRQQISIPFSPSELHCLHIVEPMLRAAIERQQAFINSHAISTEAAEAAEDTPANNRLTLHTELKNKLNDFGKTVLTDRELEVMQQMLKGKSSKVTAKVLHISPDTERGHRKRIYTKLGVTSQSELMYKLLETLVDF